MALGTGNYQNARGNQQQYEPTYYSRLRMNNPKDNLSLQFSYWKGMLKIYITEAGSAQEGRANELASIYLSPTKARLMVNCIDKIIDDEKSSDIYGINTGIGEVNGFMAISREAGVPYLIIAKVSQNGYESSQRFNFNHDYDYFLQVSDLENLKYKKEYNNSIELKTFRDLLEDYARAASGAYGAAYYDIGRYEAAKNSNMVRKIAEKVGVELYNGNNNYNGRNNFSQPSGDASRMNNSSNKRYSNIDELDSEL